jgi:predicted ATPase
VFAGSFSLEAAEAICGTSNTSLDVLSRLLRLVDKSLVLAEAGTDGVVRYRLLETLRQFARDRLRSSPDDVSDMSVSSRACWCSNR